VKGIVKKEIDAAEAKRNLLNGNRYKAKKIKDYSK